MSEIPKEERVGYAMKKEIKAQLKQKINGNFNGTAFQQQDELFMNTPRDDSSKPFTPIVVD